MDEQRTRLAEWWGQVGWGDLLTVALLLVVTPVVIWLYARGVRWLADQYPRVRLGLLISVPVIRLTAWLTVIVVIIFAVLSPPQEVLLAVGASAALAIGLALQDVLKSVLAGIVMLFQRPFAVGDMVELDGHYGEVVGTGLVSVQLRTFNDSIVTLLNSKVFAEASLNSNTARLQELVPVELTVFGLVDSVQIRAICEEVLACSPYVTLERPITVMVADAGEYRTMATRFVLKGYVSDVRCEKLMATDVLLRAHRALRASGLLTGDATSPGIHC